MKNWKTSATTKAMAWLCGLLCYSSTLVSSVLYLFVRNMACMSNGHSTLFLYKTVINF